MSKSNIEWTEQTWNPVVGCSIVSPGCTNCYAMKMAARIEAMSEAIYDRGERTPPAQYCGTTKKVNGNAVWTGLLSRAPRDTLLAPLKRKKPTTYFVNSMGDLFHEDCPDEWIDEVFAVMALSPQHTFKMLTKRAGRMRQWFAGDRADRVGLAILTIVDRIPHGHRRVPWPLANVWLGVSAERQKEANERVPDLLATPAAIRFISAEPLLGAVDLTRVRAPVDPHAPDEEWLFNALKTGDYYEQRFTNSFGEQWFDSGDGPYRDTKIDWVIVGGESGMDARPAHPDWYRSLRDQCASAGTAFFFKQFGEWGMPTDTLGALDWPYHRDHDRTFWFDRRTCARPTETGWSDKYHDAGAGALRPPPFDLWQTPEYLDQVSRCPQIDCREARKCCGNHAMAAVTRVGKKAAGRTLDGTLHDAMPHRHSSIT